MPGPCCESCSASFARGVGSRTTYCDADDCQRVREQARRDRRRAEGARRRVRLAAVAAMPPASKICSTCRSEKPAAEFYAMSASLDRLQSACRPCNLASSRDAYLRREYGIGQVQYDALLEAQGGVCAICSENRELLAVDHDHTTGEVRGLLCNPCNRGIGLLKDDPDRMLAAAMYVLANRRVLEMI